MIDDADALPENTKSGYWGPTTPWTTPKTPSSPTPSVKSSMSEYRSVSMSASDGKISVDASLAQELVEFLTRRYEQVKEELEQLKVRVSEAVPGNYVRLAHGYLQLL